MPHTLLRRSLCGHSRPLALAILMAGVFSAVSANPAVSSGYGCGVGPWHLVGSAPAIRLRGANHPPSRYEAQQIGAGVIGVRTGAGDLMLPIAPDEHFFGLGERFEGPDLLGNVLEAWTEDREVHPDRRTSYVATPFLLSSHGYGILLDTTARSTFDIGASHPDCLVISAATSELRTLLIEGPDPETVLERHAALVGRPPLPPRWAFGVWKTEIGGEQRILGDLDRLRAEGIPTDAVWVYDAVDPSSGFGWPWKLYGPIDPGTYPDLPAFVQRLHDRSLRVLGYLNPFLYQGTPPFEEAASLGYLVLDSRGDPVIQPWNEHAYVDLTNPAATAWWKGRVTAGLLGAGFDGAMLDFGEDAPTDGVYASGEPGSLVHNLYPVLYAQAVYTAAEAAKPGATVFFARAGFSGSEQFTTGGFTGDQERSWDPRTGLPSVIPALLSAGISGRPYWGPDIAGFIDWREPPAEKELWMRWLELGALTPTMRDMLGAEQHPVDLWTDRATTAAFRFYARLHTSLEPYIYRYAQVAHERGLPIVRPLFLDYPRDPVTYGLNDEYLLGDGVLVAPVTRESATSRDVYLPAGTWTDAWTGHLLRGPAWMSVDAPVNRIPLFERAGAGIDLTHLVKAASP
jgi:alpha-glucosidase (family GH31 glycosyl hydrolase)